MGECTFKTASGGDPAEYIIRLANDAKPTEGDALYAAQRQKTRMIERTLRGVDVNERAFEPYSTNGPYYYSPLGRVGRTKATVKQKKAAVRRLLKRTAGVSGWKAKLAKVRIFIFRCQFSMRIERCSMWLPADRRRREVIADVPPRRSFFTIRQLLAVQSGCKVFDTHLLK